LDVCSASLQSLCEVGRIRDWSISLVTNPVTVSLDVKMFVLLPTELSHLDVSLAVE
jgi:hypothetical protein